MTTTNQSPEWKLAPTKATPEMLAAGGEGGQCCMCCGYDNGPGDPGGLFELMLEAAQPAQPAQCVAEGWKLVPIEPTWEMCEAGCPTTESFDRYDLKTVWAAMLAATPAPAPSNGFAKALDIRAAQGWTLTGNAIPVLYTDTINGDQVMRDDVWLCTTAALKTEVPAPAVPRVEVCCQRFDTCRSQCVPLVDHLRGQIKELKVAPAVPQGFSVTRHSDGTLYVSHERFGFMALTDDEKRLEGRLLYTLAGALLSTPAVPAQEPVTLTDEEPDPTLSALMGMPVSRKVWSEFKAWQADKEAALREKESS